MSQCLKDRSLLLLHEGEGTGTQQSHLADCESCATRYRQLKRDLEAIERVLREEPPPEVAPLQPLPFRLRWYIALAQISILNVHDSFPFNMEEISVLIREHDGQLGLTIITRATDRPELHGFLPVWPLEKNDVVK